MNNTDFSIQLWWAKFVLSREKLEEDIAPRLILMVNNIKAEIG